MEQKKSKSLSFLIFIPLLSLIFIRPFVSGMAYPVFELYYETCLTLFGIITLCLSVRRLKYMPKDIYIVIPIAIMLISYTISTILSINIQNSIKELLKFISCLSIFFIISMAEERQKKLLIKTIVFSALIISGYAIYQYFWGYQQTIDYINKTNSDALLTSPYTRDILLGKRAIGTFLSPNIFAGYLIVVLFLVYYAVNRTIAIFQIVIITIAIILTKSFGAWLSLAVTLMVMLLFFYKDIKKYKFTVTVCLILVIIGTAFIVLSRWHRLMNLENPHNSITQRLNYWRIAIAAIKDRPISGIGPGNFQEVFLRYKAGWSIDTRYVHNIFLQTWLETGIFGFIGMLFLVITFIGRSISKSRYLFLAGLVFIIHNLIDITYFIPETGLLLWVLMGLASDQKGSSG